MGKETACRPKRGAWTEALGEAFLALLRETGNAAASSRALGHRHLFNNRMLRHPDFGRACRAAAAEAQPGLERRLANGPFLRPAPIEMKSLPPKGGPPPREERIRRTSNGRLQISHVRDDEWNSRIEAAFLARLSVTGNITRSAQAVGFCVSTIFNRLERWPAFARACEQALDEAGIRLDYKLVAHAHSLLRRLGESAEPAGEEEDEDIPFDPAMAMRILTFIDSRKARRTTRGRRKGVAQRTFEEAKASILAKIEAIERHEKLMRERGEEDGGEEGGG